MSPCTLATIQISPIFLTWNWWERFELYAHTSINKYGKYSEAIIKYVFCYCKYFAYTVSIKKRITKAKSKILSNPSIKDSKTYYWFGGDGSKVKSDITSIVSHFDFNQIMYARNIFHNIKDTLKIMNIFFLNIFLVLFFNINYLLARMNKELLWEFPWPKTTLVSVTLSIHSQKSIICSWFVCKFIFLLLSFPDLFCNLFCYSFIAFKDFLKSHNFVYKPIVNTKNAILVVLYYKKKCHLHVGLIHFFCIYWK